MDTVHVLIGDTTGILQKNIVQIAHDTEMYRNVTGLIPVLDLLAFQSLLSEYLVTIYESSQGAAEDYSSYLPPALSLHIIRTVKRSSALQVEIGRTAYSYN